MEDRSALFNQLKNFSQRKLKKVETKVVTASGEQLVEKRGAKGLQVLSGDGAAQTKEAEPARKLDLQVGLVLPGFLIGSQDVAHDKSSLDSYGVTHILNLDSEVENKFEDDYNYKNVAIQDKPDYELERVLEDCFDFIDDGRHYGNVLIHCSGTIGLSRSTTLCIAYLMNKEKQSFADAFNNVKEVRSFVKPNDGFIKQLKDYEVKLRGAQKVKESGIDDPFALRKKQEIEQEKAMVAGAASVKNRMKMFGATLDTSSASNSNRSKSVSPAPPLSSSSAAATTAKPTTPAATTPASKWSTSNSNSKSMTPEPRKSWQQPTASNNESNSSPKPTSDWRSRTSQPASSAPPPPPPIPTGSLHSNDKSIKPLSSSSSRQSAALPPPPPPPPPSVDLLSGKSHQKESSRTATTTSSSSSHRKPSISESSDDDRQKMVFGRRPPPPMKIRGGLSIERQDSIGSSAGDTKKPTTQPLISGSFTPNNGQQQAAHNYDKRCASPLVLMNNVTMNSRGSAAATPSPRVTEEVNNPFKYWQQNVNKTSQQQQQPSRDQAAIGQLPKRTVSLGPRRQVFSNISQNSDQAPNNSSQQFPRDDRAKLKHEIRSYNEAARELQSSLTELDRIINDSAPSTPQLDRFGNNTGTRPPKYSTAASQQANQFKNVPLIRTTANEQQPGGGDSSPPTSADGEQPKRWQWQEDLENWKLSSSVNDLKSMFEKAPKLNLPPPGQSTLSSGDRPPRSASPNVLRKSFWEQKTNQDNEQPGATTTGGGVYADYTIRRTTSTSSSQRPVLRNPYRNHNWK